MTENLRILIVDDSLIFRSAVTEALKGQRGIEVVGSVWNGAKAMDFIRENRPDLVTLDLEMPEMDGLATLRAIEEYNNSNKAVANVGVIMVSAHTHKGASTTIDALEAGAFDFVAKPEGASAEDSLGILRNQLLPKVYAFATQYRKYLRESGVAIAPIAPASVQPAMPANVPVGKLEGIQAVVVGVSTGGPRALSTFLPELTKRIKVPVLIVQHMPPVFTESLASSLNKKSNYTVVEAAKPQTVKPQTAYIAPGGMHMVVRKAPTGEIVTSVNDQPPENNCRPSVDVLFRSAATVFGGKVVAVVLTGMGNDGTKGLSPLRRHGAHVIVQDEATSVVWGMPGSAVAAGMVDQVLPLMDIPAAVEFLVGSG